MTKRLYTLADAQRELARRECEMHHHDIDVVYVGLSTDPARIVCSRCGDSWAVLPKETT